MVSLGFFAKARELDGMAEWYFNLHSTALAEYCRYAHRTVYDLIDTIRSKCKTANIELILDVIVKMREESWNDYTHYQREHFEHFAELAMVRHDLLHSIEFKLCSNMSLTIFDDDD